MYALQFFDTDASRGLLCESLLDGDLEVRTQAVRGLSKVGDERSLHYLANYIDREDPRYVGNVASAWEVVEQISGRSFDRTRPSCRRTCKKRNASAHHRTPATFQRPFTPG